MSVGKEVKELDYPYSMMAPDFQSVIPVFGSLMAGTRPFG
jgi:hypothetical protein